MLQDAVVTQIWWWSTPDKYVGPARFERIRTYFPKSGPWWWSRFQAYVDGLPKRSSATPAAAT